MAGLTPIPLAAHLSAVAYLRARLFVNGFRRKGGKGELVAIIIAYPILAVIALAPILGAGLGSYAAIHTGHPQWITFVFWGVFFLWTVVSVNVSPPTLAFEPESLIRFPISFPRYLLIRLLLGLLAASTVVGAFSLLAAVIGIGIARPSLAPVSIAAALIFAITNILFTRMVFAWVDRWLSTRRSREVFTGLIFAFGIGMQYLNVTFNGIGKHLTTAQRLAKMAAAEHFLHAVEPVASLLPPSLAARAIQSPHGLTAIASLAAVLAYALVCLGIFAWRTQREYRGERLSDTPPIAAPIAPARTHAPLAPTLIQTPATSSGVATVLGKELLYIRRNTSQFYGLAAPILMVVIFAGRLGTLSRTGFAFPVGLVYCLLGLAAFSYNTFGLEQSGIQLYFLAPIRFRSIVLAKNLLAFALTALQCTLVFAVVTYAAGPPPIRIIALCLLWAVAATFANTALGNLRSFSAPKKMDPSKLTRKQANQLSALMAVALMLASAAVTAGLYLAGEYLHLVWLPFLVLTPAAAAAALFYLTILNRSDALALQHRETLIEALAKAS